MRRLASLLAITLLLAGCGSQAASTSPGFVRASDPRAPGVVSPSDAHALATGNAKFAGRLLALVAAGDPTVALSPYSVSDTLAMTYAGARGRTATEMASALDFALPQDRLHAAFNALDQSLDAASSQATTLRTAGALFGQRTMAFRPAFLSTLARDYGSGVRTVDFATSPQAARATINAWVSKQTDGKIAQLLSASDVTPSTRLVLTNAVYLNARWASPFTSADTSPSPFHASGGTVQVPTMHQTTTFDYASHPGYQVLQLRYKGGRLAFDIVLPGAGELRSVIGRIGRAGPLALLGGLAPERVSLALPKLLLRTHFELADALSELGMPIAFAPGQADFSGISGPPGEIALEHVVHEAYVRVDEEGTEAAAATGAVAIATAVAPLPAIPFNVNRPFVFVLRDTATQAILFLGVVSNPSAP